MGFTYTEPRGYVVETTFDHGQSWHEIYRGTDRDRAAEVCNFWDERQDTTFTDLSVVPMDAASVAQRKLDALLAYLDKRIDANYNRTVARIDRSHYQHDPYRYQW